LGDHHTESDGINEFKNKLAENKVTMILLLLMSTCKLFERGQNGAELLCSRSTKVTSGLVTEYQEWIKTTVSDLQDRLGITTQNCIRICRGC
jgi:hypothetical protein